METEELQTFAKLIEDLRPDQLKGLLFALASAMHYEIPIYSAIRQIETGMKEKKIDKREILKKTATHQLDSIPGAVQNFFYGIGWHNRTYKKLTEQAIKLVIERLLL